MSEPGHHQHQHDRSACRRYLGSLSDYVEGELSEELCRELEAHMAVCQNCRVVVNTLAKTISLYREMPAPDMPNTVRERLYSVLDLKQYYKPASDEAQG